MSGHPEWREGRISLPWPSHVSAEIIDFALGEQLSFGQDREVYQYALDDAKIIKLEVSDRAFQNVIEWKTWQDLRDTRYAKYLAPCHYISPGGRLLVMDKVQVCEPGLVVKLPGFLTDLKAENYGMLKGRLVACDYGLNLLLNHGAFSSKLRRVKLTKD